MGFREREGEYTYARAREKVQTLARGRGAVPGSGAEAAPLLPFPPRFTSFLFSSLKHHFADGCIACIIMGSKESLPQNAASEGDRAKCSITWTDLFNFTPPRSCLALMMLFSLVTSAYLWEFGQTICSGRTSVFRLVKLFLKCYRNERYTALWYSVGLCSSTYRFSEGIRCPPRRCERLLNCGH